jgi:hypothetical protein
MISSNRILGFSVARRGTRRALVLVYWSFLALSCVAFLIHQARHGFDGGSVVFTLQFLVFLTALLGGVRAGGFVKPFRGVHLVPLMESGGLQSLLRPANPPAILEDAGLDERESRLRDRVHFVAYTLTRWFALLLFVLYGAVGFVHAAWLALAGPFFFFLLTMTLWSLPQSIILWTEPDMEEAQ